MKRYLLYALELGETRSYMEDLLVDTSSKSYIEYIKPQLERQGFHNFRLATYDDNDFEKPDIIKTIN